VFSWLLVRFLFLLVFITEIIERATTISEITHKFVKMIKGIVLKIFNVLIFNGLKNSYKGCKSARRGLNALLKSKNGEKRPRVSLNNRKLRSL